MVSTSNRINIDKKFSQTEFSSAGESSAERVVLCRLILPNESPNTPQEDLEELSFLVRTAGGVVVGVLTQRREHPDPAMFIGKGKAEELRELIHKVNAHTVIFDDDLRPAQVRNLSRTLGNNTKILDRSGLILDIFATHARSREAKIQVELAQLEYMLPRLTGMWRHLERQYGVIGVRGPGERQIELDRRIIQRRISKLKRSLARIERERKVQRKRRKNLFRLGLVGYTNAGKSSLLNRLAGANALVEDMLFATLDPMTRKISDGDNSVLITDTVGFIKKLPHHLIESFKSTLAEAQEADFLLLIADANHPAMQEHITIVHNVLNEIGATDKRILAVNKIDLLTDDELAYFRRTYPSAFLISALTGKGIETLREKIFHLADKRKRN